MVEPKRLLDFELAAGAMPAAKKPRTSGTKKEAPLDVDTGPAGNAPSGQPLNL